MRNTCLLVHGFNVSDDGQSTIGRLVPYLSSRQMPSIIFKTGFLSLIDVRLFNKRHARRLAEAARNAKALGLTVTAVGHSNGCSILHHATTLYDAPIDYMAYINPALDPELAPGPQVAQLDVWYSPDDPWVKLSRLLPRHIWGEMGATGYQGDDPRITNFDKQAMEVSSSEHSDFAKAEQLAYYGPVITQRIQDYVDSQIPYNPALPRSLGNGISIRL